MKKTLVAILAIILLVFSIRSGYLLIFYGNPKKINDVENIMLNYLKEEKGYQDKDIISVKGNYNFKEPHGEKYGGRVVLRTENKLQSYEYKIKKHKVFEYEKIPFYRRN
ncbi:hypothetical protein [Virgibacillus halophilus]|uniref:hypothetical protein n=1 Tax=Tigheibacillus halophilus TaxID=361280 RepID=UPI0036F30E7B